jgi:CBS domain-containing protein
MLTVNDIIHLIQYYYKTASQSEAAQMVEKFRLGKLRDIENTLHVPPPPLLSIDPMRPLFEACQLLLKTHARRLPLLDHDDQTGMDVVVSVLTQYRVLKFIAMNCRETSALHRSIRSLGIGTYIASMSNQTRSMTAASNVSSSRRSSNEATTNVPPVVVPVEDGTQNRETLTTDGSEVSASAVEEVPQERRGSGLDSMYPLATVTLETTVFDVIHIFSELGVSAVPVLDEDGYAVDMYETVDVIDLVRAGAYQQLDLTIREALARRSKDFSGVMTCSPDDSLATIFALLRTRRVHRLLILEPETSVPSIGKVPGLDDQTGPEGLQEDQKMMNAAIASDTTAVGDSVKQSADGTTAKQNDNSKKEASSNALEDIPHRKRGKLVGILCLSDVMRYLIASPGAQAAEKVGRLHGSARTGSGLAGAGTSFSTAPSSLDAHDAVGSAPRSRQTSTNGPGVTGHAATTVGEEEHGLSSVQAMAVGPSKSDLAEVATLADAASRFDPKDVPPTIEEHPTGEVTVPVTQEFQE